MSKKLFELFQKAADDAYKAGLIEKVQKEEFFMSGKSE